MNDLKCEFVRNQTGYFLVLVGAALLCAGAHFQLDKLVETGRDTMAAALLAFQVKRPENPKV